MFFDVPALSLAVGFYFFSLFTLMLLIKLNLTVGANDKQWNVTEMTEHFIFSFVYGVNDLRIQWPARIYKKKQHQKRRLFETFIQFVYV